MKTFKSVSSYQPGLNQQKEPIKKYSVVETTDAASEVGHYSFSKAGEAVLNPEEHSNSKSSKNSSASSSQGQMRGDMLRDETASRYSRAGRSFHHHSNSAELLPGKSRREKAAGLGLLQKILLANMVIILAGAMVGSYFTAQLAEAGKFNFLSFAIIITTAVLLSTALNFVILKLAFRPFEDLQRVISKIHTGNPRARAALTSVTNPDVRQFTSTVNQMLNRLEENARIIQEDQRQLQLMTARVINAQENERKRIARELHDEASQAITAMIMGLESARQDVTPQDRLLQAKLDGLKQLAGATLEELRKLALDLRPTMLDDLGLLPAVRWLSRTAAERANLEIKVKVEGFDESERLAPEVETCLFRITQESLTNITRHAAARQVEIKLERIASFETEIGDGWGAVRLSVADDGKGFRPAEAKVAAYKGGHLGLFDIEERAALLGGKLEIESYVNHEGEGPHGTKIVVTVPLSGRPVELSGQLDTNAPPYTHS